MSRSERLFDLIQALRRHRRPVSGAVLATETGVSIRTLYRDIATLQGQGAPIEGEPGLGYVLRPGFMLVLGSRWVAGRADGKLALAARNALAKIAAVLPDDLRNELDASSLLVAPGQNFPAETVDLSVIRKAIRSERKLGIAYEDAQGAVSERLVWPFALGFFDRVRVVVAWCELRQDFRHFRTDRMSGLSPTDTRYPRRRQILLKEWREAEKIRPSS
jgi:predicted DNA-binding transcriptional regulator YafY